MLAASCPTPDQTTIWGHPVTGWIHLGVVKGDDYALAGHLAEWLTAGHIPTFVHDDIWRFKHTKWASNQAGAAMALVRDDWIRVAEAATAEATAILQAAGAPLAEMSELMPPDYSTVEIDGQRRDGGATRQSLIAGKPLETPLVTQPLLQLAEAFGVDAPVNSALLLAAQRAESEGWTEPKMSASDILNIYQLDPKRYVAATKNKSFNAGYERPASLALMGPVDGMTVLDAGCGPGHHAAHMAAQGATVHAFDRSGPMVQQAQQRIGGQAHVQVADLTGPLPYANDAMDAVLCSLALHYVEHLGSVFREFARVLRPGGHLVFSLHPPNDDLPIGHPVRVTETWNLLGPVEVSFWDRHSQDLWAPLRAAGFTVDATPSPAPERWVEQAAPRAWKLMNRQDVFVFARARYTGEPTNE